MEHSAEYWEYDGSFLGFMTVVDHCFRKKCYPAAILTPETAAQNLFLPRLIKTEAERGERIYQRLQQRLSEENLLFIQKGFHSSLEEKELFLLQAIEIALRTNDLLENHIGHPAILALQKSIHALTREAHSFKGFVRFDHVGDVWYSSISPKHFVLPYLCPHFLSRYPAEKLMIYDETHQLLATMVHGKVSLLEGVAPPNITISESEQAVHARWRRFFQAVTIKERTNKETQRSRLPLRFRGNMTEFTSEDV